MRLLPGILIAMFLGIIVLACAGGVINFSPVPHTDMWDGTLEFILDLRSGKFSEIWAQHNEHRIVLARGLFWLEYEIFGGTGAFLVIANFLLVLGAGVTFWRALIWRNRGAVTAAPLLIAALAILAWLSLWTQEDNLTWAFQSQFFLAQLLPLISLLVLARAGHGPVLRDAWFGAALALGVLSVGTMANGLLVQPLMILCALVLRFSLARIFILILMFAVCAWLYFYGYQSPSGHGSLIATLIERPVGLLSFTFKYLGSPFYELSGLGPGGRWIATLAGVVLTAVSAATANRVLRDKRPEPPLVALLLFIMHIGGTAFVTGGGRLLFGEDGALTSRYSTPALMAWAALFVIYSPGLFALVRERTAERFATLLLLIGVSGFALLYQFKALTPNYDTLHRRDVAALAIELQILDRDFIASVYPAPEVALAIGARASAANLAVFGLEGFRDLAGRMGAIVSQRGLRACAGNFDAMESVAGENGYVRVRGWLFDDVKLTSPRWIDLVDSQGIQVGYAIGGAPRPDVAELVNRRAGRSGFTGYLKASALGEPVLAESGACFLHGTLFPSLVAPIAEPVDAGSVSAVLDIAGDNAWTGADYLKTSFPGLTVLGTFITSDTDKGAVRLRLKVGDRLLYNSGPTPGRQVIRLADNPSIHSILPTATSWTVLEITAGAPAGGSQVYELADEGDGWGEWSAVALLTPQ